MNPQDELLEIIDHYLSNGMSDGERFAFEEKMAQDKTLSAKVDEVRAANQAIYYASLAELKATIGQDIKKIKYTPSFNWKQASYISIASLVLISGVTAYLVSNNKKDTAGKTQSDSLVQTAEQNPAQQTNIPVSGKTDIQKPVENRLRSTQHTSDTAHKNHNTSSQEKALADQHIENNSKALTTHAASENKSQTTDNNATIKKTLTPAATDLTIQCDKSFTIHAEAACKQKESGSIAIQTDGAYEYTFQVDNHSTKGSRGYFPNISAGDYDILVTYGKECTYKKKITVGEKWCAMNEPYSFNPDYNEKWTMRYETGASGRFIIYDRSGKEIYSGIFGNGNEYWDGADIHGGIAAIGVYIAVLNYSDGRKEKVELTLVR